MTRLPVPESMTCGPEAAKMNARMSEIGEELARYPFGSHPNSKELEKELADLKSTYPKVLESGK
ncbi:MAG: hypothetical protein ACR2L2_07005 [Acidobacteriota bacterium]